MTWIVDRIENGIAVCEIADGKTIDVPVTALPADIKEGDVITLSYNAEEAAKRKERINNLMNRLFED
ncbi:MAG: DUF3006 domain-containing protein [Clostridium sp.]|nr:DUF3006 domain-containing protein [Clostridium sp.]